ncbi:MAG: hypothetical protein DI565_12810 [Ancylobacter novellus]|uniref:Uncharacterized protein n=1 Tax=Ancylobacter novellus TaxID=921 RepID=A0A2W5KEW4_ANCNO|nr:MAG: hypothetical protein DI565_12810 [Ancylobacter novellus]
MTDKDDERSALRALALGNEWHKRIVADFPEQFPRGEFGFETLGGWRHMLREMCRRVSLLTPEQREGHGWTQIKEKFGTLRAYHTGGPAVDEVVDWAEEVSEVTCDVCGAPGRLRNTKGWYATRCDEHDGWRGW